MQGPWLSWRICLIHPLDSSILAVDNVDMNNIYAYSHLPFWDSCSGWHEIDK
jgi:hypothetical protein